MNQSGSGGSDYVSQWYSLTPLNIHKLDQYTVNNLNNSPMFSPLKPGTAFPTPTNGLIPTSIHLSNSTPRIGYVGQNGGTDVDDDKYFYQYLKYKKKYLKHRNRLITNS